MSTKSTTVRARLEPDLKEEAELILEQLGISTAEAIRIFFKQVQLQRGMPFDLKLPNATTKKALDDATARKRLSSSTTAQELFDDLGI
ncbi:MAG: type II toxin-antitoxin system RelB/DinJ family antitoxin [Balneolaceae bacterium]|nr:MAG: type II toxin-antitoxin system RelB/DinJ family antitoxin [Balneolaceae bacterium]